MNINVENPTSLRRKVTIELGPEEIGRELNRAYNELRRSVTLKGFRPGHAPQKLLERLFGDQVRSDAIQKLIAEYTEKALDEHKLKPVAQPEIVTEESDLAKTLRFSATFDVKPEIAVKDYQALKVQKHSFEVKEEEVDQALERMRERAAPLKRVEERMKVERGDFAVVEIEAFADGKALEGFKSGERMFEISEKVLAHGLDELLVGAEAGKEVRKLKRYGADYSQKELAGKDVEWRATVKQIYVRETPKLDDEFAKDQGEASLADLRAKVRGYLEEHARREAESRVRQGLLDLVIERNPVELPESLVGRELAGLESELEATLEANGAAREQARARVAEQREELRTRAERRVHSMLILDALADQENVGASDEEVADRIARQVTESGRERNRVAEFYNREENREALKRSMRRDKVLDLLLERAQVESEEAGASTSSP